MINQLVNPYTTSLTPEDVNFFQVNDASRGMRADASMFKTAETEDGSAGTGSADTSVRTRNMTDPAETRKEQTRLRPRLFFCSKGKRVTDIK